MQQTARDQASPLPLLPQHIYQCLTHQGGRYRGVLAYPPGLCWSQLGGHRPFRHTQMRQALGLPWQIQFGSIEARKGNNLTLPLRHTWMWQPQGLPWRINLVSIKARKGYNMTPSLRYTQMWQALGCPTHGIRPHTSSIVFPPLGDWQARDFLRDLEGLREAHAGRRMLLHVFR